MGRAVGERCALRLTSLRSEHRPRAAHVLQVISSDARRGAESFATDVQRVLTDRGRDARIAALRATGNDRTFDVPVLGDDRWRALPELRRRANQASVVVGHGSDTLLACAIATAGIDTPFVYRNIGAPLYWAGSFARRHRVRLALKRATRVAALWPGSAAILAEHLGVSEERIRVIPNARPADRFPLVDPAMRAAARSSLSTPAGVGDDRPIVVSVGALSQEKGPDVLVEAMARLPEWRVVFAGTGPMRAQLEAQASSIGVAAAFVGATDDPAGVLAAADVVVLPSRTEGLPGVAIEAGLMGLPVVATDVGGTSEIVVDGETGTLVPSEDPAALADAVERTLPVARTLGAAARRRCLERFELHVVVDQWEAMLDEIAGEPW